MVVFGGQRNKMVGSLGSIYVLDLESMSWTKGADVDRALWRSNMACTVAGDNFVAWGGKVNYDIREWSLPVNVYDPENKNENIDASSSFELFKKKQYVPTFRIDVFKAITMVTSQRPL